MKKKINKKLMEQVQILLKERGQKAFEIAKNAILQEKIKSELVYEALRYFIEESWYDVQHPALISLTCEAVDGNPNSTVHIGAAMVLLAGAADIHDDIIDKSRIKCSKPTVFGKFGNDIAILAGDALLFKGATLLNEACEKLPEKQGKTILNLTKQAFFEIGSAEAKEATLKGKYDLTPEEYYHIIEMKAAVAEANARIGAIVGGGKPKQIEALGCYGRTLGILMSIRYDFVDIFEPEELKNRVQNEILPLPLLYAFTNPKTKNTIMPILLKTNITEDDAQTVVSTMFKSRGVRDLKENMHSLMNLGMQTLHCVKKSTVRRFMKALMESSVEDL